jgi:hypothetical protein
VCPGCLVLSEPQTVQVNLYGRRGATSHFALEPGRRQWLTKSRRLLS